MGVQHTTGLALRPGAVEWTVLRESRKGLEVVDHGREEWEVAGDGDPYAAPEAQAALRKAAGRVRGEISVAAESAKTLLRVVDLPSTDPVELAGMAELQVDKFSPFPVEQMAIAVEPLATTEKSTRTLIATTQRELVEQVGAELRKAGLHAHRVDVEVLGWWQLLREAKAIPPKGRKAFLLMGPGGAELVLARDGQPVLFRSLGAPGETPEGFLDEVVEETAYTLTAAESEIGSGDMVPLEIRYRKDRPSDNLAVRLKDACAVEPSILSLESLPPLSEGLAHRALDAGARRFSLAPPAWGVEEQSREVRRKLLIWSAGFLLVWLAVAGGLLVGLRIRRHRQDELTRAVAALEGPATEARAIKDRVEAFERYTERSFSALECLRTISSVQPQGIDLNSYEYSKGEEVVLQGVAQVVDTIFDFSEELKKLFPSAKSSNINPLANDPQKRSFTMTIGLPGGAVPEEEAP